MIELNVMQQIINHSGLSTKLHSVTKLLHAWKKYDITSGDNKFLIV